jgi:hypothetical protein
MTEIHRRAVDLGDRDVHEFINEALLSYWKLSVDQTLCIRLDTIFKKIEKIFPKIS